MILRKILPSVIYLTNVYKHIFLIQELAELVEVWGITF